MSPTNNGLKIKRLIAINNPNTLILSFHLICHRRYGKMSRLSNLEPTEKAKNTMAR
nr:hypothetical protein [uncultured bacterium]